MVVSTKLLVACSAAVAAVYAGAYFYTEPVAHSAAATTTTSSSHHQNSSSSAPTSSSHTTSAQYQDGTYTGSSTNAFGALSVSVVISGGKITAVNVTNYEMHYPVQIIDPTMNDEVLKDQTYHVYAVSGATQSSENFAYAVYEALQKAKA